MDKNLTQVELENQVVDLFKHAGVTVKNRDFHAIHRMGKKGVVIAKCVNRRDATAILRAKKKLRELAPAAKTKFKTTKIYVNESLCPAYRRLFAVSNELRKQRKLNEVFTVNGKLKMKDRDDTIHII